MKHQLILTFLLTIICCSTYGQALEKLKLTDKEVPAQYKPTEEILYKSVQARTFYDQTDLYAAIIGNVKSKTYQSYGSNDDSGAIYYYEFEEKFEAREFLGSLLWGGKKPTKAHPEEIFVKDNILVIWSFVDKSALKKISKDKITTLLK